MLNPFKKIATALRRRRELAAMPLRLEFVLTDYCNLNCRGCTHYSPLAAKEFAPINQIEHEIRHLGRICSDGIDSAYLIGGETLLYPDLCKAMELLREAFAKQKLFVFTNGLMLPRMSDEFWTTAARLGFVIALTRYPVKFDYDAAIELCRSKGVACEVFGDRSMADSFYRFSLDPKGRNNARLAHFRCFNRGCVSVLGGYVYPCSISACVSHLNKAHSTTFEHRDGDRIAVDSVRSAADIKRLRDRPVPFCRYCRKPDTVPYAPSKRERAEWVEEKL
ncbi:MAG: radical SAM protein [Muribaculaceae bacterium]|nr:radical SAM protein [Muribaculaceae bacterium]